MRKFPPLVDNSRSFGVENESVWKVEPRRGTPPILFHGHGHGFGLNTPYKFDIGDGLGNGYNKYPYSLIQYWKN